MTRSHPGQKQTLAVAPITRSRARDVQRSPIFKLPSEVLSMIFILMLPNDLELGKEWCSPGQRRPQGRSPLLLCAVCSLWRACALATPQLWRQIFIHISQDMSKTTARLKANRLLLWIQRSRSLPLALYLSSERFFSHAGRKPFRGTPVISVLKQQANRWRALYLQKPLDNVLLEIFKSEQYRPSPSSRRRVHHPNTMPQENQLTSWVQLTHLQICRSISAQQALVIFKACSKLVWLSINRLELPHGPAYSKPPIILPDLVSISLGFKSFCLRGVMTSISAPSLREMCIGIASSTWTISADGESLLYFLTQSSCTLDRLELSGVCKNLTNTLITTFYPRASLLRGTTFSCVEGLYLFNLGILRSWVL